MRKSQLVVVTLVGSVALTSCYDGHNGTVYKSQYTREYYRNLNECQKAWGKSDNNCLARSGTTGYYGPYHGASTPGGNILFYGYSSNGTVASTAYTKSSSGSNKVSTFKSAPAMNGKFATSATSRGGFGATASGRGTSFGG